MIESKIELTHRLRREGRWEEASRFKDETIRRLRGEGTKRSEAQEAAWEAMEHEFPPIIKACELAVEALETNWEDFGDVTASTPESYIEDATWVYDRLAVKDVRPSDAPSTGAWSLLQWARANQDRFFEQVMPKVFSAGQKLTTEISARENRYCDNLEEAEEIMRRFFEIEARESRE